MPHKRNPIVSERLSGLARLIRSNSIAALENVPLWHERDISHSSVERVIIPDSTIAIYYMLNLSVNLVKNLIVYPDQMENNFRITRGLIYSQSVLLALVNKGLTREDAYKMVQEPAMEVWQSEDKNLKDELIKSEAVTKYLSKEEIEEIFDINKTLENIDKIFQRTIDLE
jgi:adenylosuccinate lyase